MPIRTPITVIRTPDGYVKVGPGPYVKWTVEVINGTKVYTQYVKEALGDTPKEVLRA